MPLTPKEQKALATIIGTAMIEEIREAVKPLRDQLQILIVRNMRQEKLIAELQTQVAERTMGYVGVFEEGRGYKKGDVVTFDGGAWICREGPTTDEPTYLATGPRSWQLMVKKGRDGR